MYVAVCVWGSEVPAMYVAVCVWVRGLRHVCRPQQRSGRPALECAGRLSSVDTVGCPQCL